MSSIIEYLISARKKSCTFHIITKIPDLHYAPTGKKNRLK